MFVCNYPPSHLPIQVGGGKDSALETLMVRRALKAVRRSDVALIVVDATEGVTDQVGSNRTK